MVAIATPTKPNLRRVPMPRDIRGKCFITMNPNQWDRDLAAAYQAGWYLLEISDDERIVAAYRKDGP